MRTETVNPIEEMRARITAERALNIAVTDRLNEKTPYLRRQLKFAGDTLDDVERMFLPSAEKGNTAMWLHGAEVLFQISVNIRKQVEGLVNQYGPNIVEIG